MAGCYEFAQAISDAGNVYIPFVFDIEDQIKDNLTKAIFNSTGRPPKPEYSVYPGKKDMPEDMYDVYMKRRRTLAAEMYRLMGVSYDDKKGRAEAMMKNFDFFGAPVGILVTVDRPYVVAMYDITVYKIYKVK